MISEATITFSNSPHTLHFLFFPCYVLRSASIFFRRSTAENRGVDPVHDRAKLTRAEIVENIHPSVKVSKQNIHKIIELFYEAVKDGLLDGRTIELRGFGSFEVKQRKGRMARNPKTGQQVQVETHGVAIFRPGTELRTRAWDLRE